MTEFRRRDSLSTEDASALGLQAIFVPVRAKKPQISLLILSLSGIPFDRTGK